MKIPQLTACALLFLGVVGCGHSTPPPKAASPDAAPAGEPSSEEQAALARARHIAVNLDEPLKNPYYDLYEGGPKDRAVGDFVVYRFTGNYRSTPLTVSQRVVEKRPGMLIIDLALEDGESKDELRLRLRHLPGQPDELISVARLENGVQRPFGTEAYEALMAKTMPPVVSNDSVIGTGEGTVTVAGTDFPCQRTAYQIFTGSATATMTTLESRTFAWGDLGGEVVAGDGTLLYRAEVVDFGNSMASPLTAEEVDAVMAAYEDQDFAPDYSMELYE